VTILDRQGRVFGRFNLIDVLVVGVALVLLPAAYAAYVLFRVPAPVIRTVEPGVLQPAEQMRVRLRGENFLPYLTAYIGRSGEPVSVFLDDRQNSMARFLIETPETAVLDLPPLRPGRYDVYLYSEAQQLAHLAEAFEVERPPQEQHSAEAPKPPPTRSMARVRVHYVVPREYAGRPRVGDYDRHGSPTLSGEPDARLTGLDLREAPASMHLPGPIANPVLLVADVRVPVSLTEQGLWWYKGQRIRPGEWLAFGTRDYYIYGLMVHTDVPESAPWDKER
jgi:hypothetical protein